MNIEGITLLNQFIEYSCKPLIIIMLFIITCIFALISVLLLEADHPIGIVILIFSLVFAFVFGSMATEEEHKTLLNYPKFTHYIIQIDDEAAWSEIAPNYTIVKEVYPNTSIYEIKREYKEGENAAKL